MDGGSEGGMEEGREEGEGGRMEAGMGGREGGREGWREGREGTKTLTPRVPRETCDGRSFNVFIQQFIIFISLTQAMTTKHENTHTACRCVYYVRRYTV